MKCEIYTIGLITIILKTKIFLASLTSLPIIVLYSCQNPGVSPIISGHSDQLCACAEILKVQFVSEVSGFLG